MVTRVARELQPMVGVDVHLAHGDAAPFASPPAPLRVVPTWAVPPRMAPPATEERRAAAAPPSVVPPEADPWLHANADGETE
jgi:hypothetical protein